MEGGGHRGGERFGRPFPFAPPPAAPPVPGFPRAPASPPPGRPGVTAGERPPDRSPRRPPQGSRRRRRAHRLLGSPPAPRERTPALAPRALLLEPRPARGRPVPRGVGRRRNGQAVALPRPH